MAATFLPLYKNGCTKRDGAVTQFGHYGGLFSSESVKTDDTKLWSWMNEFMFLHFISINLQLRDHTEKLQACVKSRKETDVFVLMGTCPVNLCAVSIYAVSILAMLATWLRRCWSIVHHFGSEWKNSTTITWITISRIHFYVAPLWSHIVWCASPGKPKCFSILTTTDSQEV